MMHYSLNQQYHMLVAIYFLNTNNKKLIFHKKKIQLLKLHQILSIINQLPAPSRVLADINISL